MTKPVHAAVEKGQDATYIENTPDLESDLVGSVVDNDNNVNDLAGNGFFKSINMQTILAFLASLFPFSLSFLLLFTAELK
jgi:hypothetical protein